MREYKNRRWFLKSTGAAALGTSIAGCMGDDNGDAEPEDVDGWDRYKYDEGEVYGAPERATPPPEYAEDPDTLHFAYVPDEDPAAYADVFEPAMDRLEEVTGKDVEMFGAGSYAAMVEAMRAGRLHIGGFGTGSVPFAVNLAGAQVFCSTADANGNVGYFLWLIVNPDAGINDVEDLEGKTVAHTEPASNSGNLAPRALFDENYGIVPEEDYEVEMSGSHEASIRGVARGDYDAAPISSIVLERMWGAGEIGEDEVEIAWESTEFPATGTSVWYKLHPDLQEDIREALVGWNFEGTVLAEHFEANEYVQFAEIDYLNAWEPIRTIGEYNDINYEELEDL